MKRNYPTGPELMNLHGHNKQIPAEYEEHIFLALHHFPELAQVRIKFRGAEQLEYPLKTTPSRISLLAPPGKRTYTISILTEAPEPMEKALLKNLPHEAKIAALAHELAHVVQFEKSGALQAVSMSLHTGNGYRELERGADIMVIEHGLGFELYTLASYLQKIPSLFETYRHADVNRLNPNEILEALPPDQLQEVHRF